MNILESAEAEVVEPSEVAAWIVPGLAFTKDGKRLGYGGGWYDRLLADANGTLKIGVAHEFQIVDDLPHEPHDILLDRVVTPERSIYCKTSPVWHR
jgi:5-formyltetrahydrofolate cyclo-ligase